MLFPRGRHCRTRGTDNTAADAFWDQGAAQEVSSAALITVEMGDGENDRVRVVAGGTTGESLSCLAGLMRGLDA